MLSYSAPEIKIKVILCLVAHYYYFIQSIIRRNEILFKKVIEHK